MLLIGIICFSCGDDPTNLQPPQERVNESINALKADLTSPINGWQLNYRPTPESGTFLILLNFSNDGLVNIKSDVANNNGEFSEQTLPYRIDNSLSLELIFETYGVFHYLFEQQQAGFGAEFEFIFDSKEGNNLIFSSKSDNPSEISIITFEPAASNAESQLSIDVSENLATYLELTSQISGTNKSIQQIILNDHNLSVFWEIDLLSRVIEVDLAGVGISVQEIVNNTDNVSIDHTTGFSFSNGNLVMEEPFSFSINGSEFTIGQIDLGSFEETSGQTLCSTNIIPTPVYNGSIPNLGGVSIQRSLFESSGVNFVEQPLTDAFYAVNIIFVFGSDGFSLAQTGSIGEKFPTAIAFAFNYGYIDNDQPALAAGFILEDDNGIRKTYLREYEVILAQGNMLQINFLDNFYYSTAPEAGSDEEQSLRDITDEIFGSGEIYIYDFPIEDRSGFTIYNPCNSYEFILVN